MMESSVGNEVYQPKHESYCAYSALTLRDRERGSATEANELQQKNTGVKVLPYRAGLRHSALGLGDGVEFEAFAQPFFLLQRMHHTCMNALILDRDAAT